MRKPPLVSVRENLVVVQNLLYRLPLSGFDACRNSRLLARRVFPPLLWPSILQHKPDHFGPAAENGLDYRQSFVISKVGITASKTEANCKWVNLVDDPLLCPLHCSFPELTERFRLCFFAMFVEWQFGSPPHELVGRIASLAALEPISKCFRVDAKFRCRR